MVSHLESQMTKPLNKILVIDDNLEFAKRLANAMESPIEPLIPIGIGIGGILDYLEKYRELDIEGIYISAELTYSECSHRTDRGGIELVKHIRLTRELESLSLKPIIVGMWRLPENYVRTRSSDIILFSPGLRTLQLPFNGIALVAELQKADCFQSFDSMYSDIHDFLPITDEDHAASEHDFRNRVGVPKLMKELFGDEAKSSEVLKDFERVQKATLWMKKMEFHQIGGKNVSDGSVSSAVLSKIRERLSDCKILLVDDEHRKGWSYLLCQALVSDIPENQFKSPDHHITVAEGRFGCVDSYPEALSYFESRAQHLQKLLDEWSDVHRRLCNAQQERKKREGLSKRIAELGQQIATKRNEVESAKRILDFHAGKTDELRTSFNQKWESLLSDRQRNPNLVTEDTNLTRKLEEIIGAKKDFDLSEGKWKDACLAQENLEQELRNCEVEYQSLKEDEKTISERLVMIQHELDALSQEFQSWHDYDLVLLDLRLDPSQDKNKNITENSGIKLLQEIKNYDPSIPVIVFTASQKAISHAEVLAYGAEGYWTKNISDAKELVSMIEKLANNIGVRRRFWMKIQQVESKSALVRSKVKEQPIVHLEDEVVTVEEELQRIKKLLRECFVYTIDAESGIARSVTELSRHEEIAIRLGQIKEFRIYFPDELKDAQSKIWASLKKNNLIDEKDNEINEYRNKVAHFYVHKNSNYREIGFRLSPVKVMENFEYTLDSLLAPS